MALAKGNTPGSFKLYLNPECRLMFILTSLWEVAALLHSRTSWCRAHTHNRNPLTSCLNLQNRRLPRVKTHFLSTVLLCDILEGVNFVLKSLFACRNFWIAYKEPRSPGFFCLVWRRWFATGLPSPFPSLSSLRNYLILLADQTLGTFLFLSH